MPDPSTQHTETSPPAPALYSYEYGSYSLTTGSLTTAATTCLATLTQQHEQQSSLAVRKFILQCCARNIPKLRATCFRPTTARSRCTILILQRCARNIHKIRVAYFRPRHEDAARTAKYSVDYCNCEIKFCNAAQEIFTLTGLPISDQGTRMLHEPRSTP
jgi:hypothetical protein